MLPWGGDLPPHILINLYGDDMFQYSFCQPCFSGEDIEVSFQRLSRLGYDGVELSGDLENTANAKQLLDKYNLQCYSINGLYIKERDISSAEEMVRKNAIEYCKSCIILAHELGAKVVVIVPTYIGKLFPDTDTDTEWKYVIQGLRTIAGFAENTGVVIVVEAVNRYESYLVNRLETQYVLMCEVNSPSMMMMGDLFHMNIEEDDICTELSRYLPWLRHIHIADNQRRPIGKGNLPVGDIMGILKEHTRKIPLTMEYDHLLCNDRGIVYKADTSNAFDKYAKSAINALKKYDV